MFYIQRWMDTILKTEVRTVWHFLSLMGSLGYKGTNLLWAFERQKWHVASSSYVSLKGCMKHFCFRCAIKPPLQHFGEIFCVLLKAVGVKNHLKRRVAKEKRCRKITFSCNFLQRNQTFSSEVFKHKISIFSKTVTSNSTNGDKFLDLWGTQSVP